MVNRIENLKFLIIETAFSDKDRRLAELALHLCPSMLAEELAKLERPAEIYITHLKPSEIELTMQEIEELSGGPAAAPAAEQPRIRVLTRPAAAPLARGPGRTENPVFPPRACRPGLTPPP